MGREVIEASRDALAGITDELIALVDGGGDLDAYEAEVVLSVAKQLNDAIANLEAVESEGGCGR